MMKENELLLPFPQAANSMPSSHSSSRLDHKTVEALTGLLQEMSVTIQTLSNRHNIACQDHKSCAFQDADMRASLANGLSISLELPSAAANVPPAHTRSRDSMPVSSQPSCRTVDGSHLFKPHSLEGNLPHTQGVMKSHGDQATGSAVALNGRCSSAIQQEVKPREMDNSVINLEGQTSKCNSEPNCRKHSLDAKTVDALRCFLDEMKRTIQVWSIRYRSLVQGQTQLPREYADVPESSHFDLASERCIDPPTADGLHCLSRDREVGVVTNPIQPTNGRAVTLCSNQPEIEFSSGFSVQSEVRVQRKPLGPNDQICEGKSGRSQHSNYLNGESLKVVEQSSQAGHLRSYAVCDSGIDCSLVPREFREEPEEYVAAISGERMLQVSTPRVVKVVESPDWLPYGWITEVKTRASGNSAGTKDKYFFDPVSKRRFRSRKEVFCFLTTGKLGRYKPKPKVLCNEAACNRDYVSSDQTTGAYPFLNKQNRPTHSLLAPVLRPSHFFSSMSCPPSFSSSPIFSSNFFVPCKPSNRPDWLMQENIINLSAPVHKHFQCFQPDAVHQESSRLFHKPCSDGPKQFSSRQSEMNGTAAKDMLMHFSHGSHKLEPEQNHFSAGCSSLNIKQLSEGSCPVSLGVRQMKQPQGSGNGCGDSGSQLVVSKLPNKIEKNWLGKRLRHSSAHDQEVGLKLPTKKLKKGKSHGKEVLEALGRVICHQGLSFLQGHKNSSAQLR